MYWDFEGAEGDDTDHAWYSGKRSNIPLTDLLQTSVRYLCIKFEVTHASFQI